MISPTQNSRYQSSSKPAQPAASLGSLPTQNTIPASATNIGFGGAKKASPLEKKSSLKERFDTWRAQKYLEWSQWREQSFNAVKKRLSQLMLQFVAFFSGFAIPDSLRNFLLRNWFFSPQKVSSSYSLKPELRQKILTVGFHPKGKNTTELNGWYVKAQAGKPTVVFSHGRDCNISHLEPIMEALSQKGYGLFVYDYPGYGRSEGSPSEEALYEASVAACKFVAGDEVAGLGVPYSQQILMGHSLGGAVAVDTARKFAENIQEPNKRIFNQSNEKRLAGQPQALILINTFTDLKEGLAEKKQGYNSYVQKWFNEKRIPLNFNSQEKIKQVSMPVLVLHGDQDTLIHKKVGQKLAFNAQNSEFRTLPGAKHKLKEETAKQVTECLGDFLQNSRLNTLSPSSSMSSSLDSLGSYLI